MTEQNNSQPPKRQFPKFYERAVPIALVILALIILVMLVFTIGVALGMFAG